MSDASVAKLLRSDEPIVVIEAPAGCGKTFQGAAYATDAIDTLGSGRLLILTHTHGACGVFADRTKKAASKVEIRTIDALIAQIATAYRKPLGLPDNLTTWAWMNEGAGFQIMASKVAAFVEHHPMIGTVLARRYPVVICDEHQDSSADQHRVIMALHRGGSRIRIFGDPLQSIFAGRTPKAMKENSARWAALKDIAAVDELDFPHRWQDGSPKLGDWILAARTELRAGRRVDLRNVSVVGLSIVRADNVSRVRGGYQVSGPERRPLDSAVQSDVMVLAGTNERIQALSAFWGRRLPVWEGHTRSALAELVASSCNGTTGPEQCARDLMRFVQSIGVGFTDSSHGERLLKEVNEKCSKATTGKPANIQKIALHILDDPTYRGISSALAQFATLVEQKADGFTDIKIDGRSELRDAMRLKDFMTPEEGFAEIARRRSHAMPTPPGKTLSTIHKAKGLECESAIVIAGDKEQFSNTEYARCKFYVAISRAKKSLTLVVPRNNISPLLLID
jgi:DNA helicase-2/ATP-dependent DNA helicase PcrA